MTKPYTAKTTDHSDSGHFSFSFYCDKCGKEWRSPNQDFTGMGSTLIENEEALRLLWRKNTASPMKPRI